MGTAAYGLGTLDAAAQEPQKPNTLSDKERADGWKLLFDGKSTSGWRGFKKDRCPDGWKVVDGALVRAEGGGDIITTEEYDNFELAFEWKVAEGANSGVFYRVSENAGAVYETAPEYQILDNAKHPDGQHKVTSAASNYALHAPTKDMTLPVGQWNRSKIVVNVNHVEHWLNGEKVVQYELGSDEWTALVKASKFKSMPRYGKEPKGHIALQDHGNHVEYRSIKIRSIKSKS
ncbi:MAG: DUF1080 domain-containing protein [Planctomycetes bacterium]|nr:DUF1080 domain-containing protein [Planctomycetota bacterium]